MLWRCASNVSSGANYFLEESYDDALSNYFTSGGFGFWKLVVVGYSVESLYFIKAEPSPALISSAVLYYRAGPLLRKVTRIDHGNRST
jgi:hypothetical protein